MNIKEQLTHDMKEAMRAQEKFRLLVIRSALAAIKQIEVDTRTVLDDGALVGVIQKMLKQRKESIKQYEAAQRQDLADVEHAESEILNHYLPAQMDQAAVKALITQAIANTQAHGVKDMGKVMAAVKPKLAGVADMGQVSQWIKEALSA